MVRGINAAMPHIFRRVIASHAANNKKKKNAKIPTPEWFKYFLKIINAEIPINRILNRSLVQTMTDRLIARCRSIASR